MVSIVKIIFKSEKEFDDIKLMAHLCDSEFVILGDDTCYYKEESLYRFFMKSYSIDKFDYFYIRLNLIIQSFKDAVFTIYCDDEEIINMINEGVDELYEF